MYCVLLKRGRSVGEKHSLPTYLPTYLHQQFVADKLGLIIYTVETLSLP